jgi:hypothetical protein
MASDTALKGFCRLAVLCRPPVLDGNALLPPDDVGGPDLVAMESGERGC